MSRACCSIILLLCSLFCAAHPPADSLNNRKYILSLDIFDTEQERELFGAAAEKGFDHLLLFLAADSGFRKTTSEAQVRQKLDASVAAWPVPVQGQAWKARELKKVYKGVHDAFLSQYVENPPFGELFVNGNYNCATATALYALLLDKVEVAYSIRETPQHVYLIAAPGVHNVVFETTTPGVKLRQISEKEKAAFLEYMYNNKMISKEEWASAEKNALFNKYFNTDEAIDKVKLAGLLYYNKGVAALEQEQYKAAYRFFEKAHYLYPAEKHKYFISFCLAQLLLEKGSMDSELSLPYVMRFADLAENDASHSVVTEYMEKLTKKLLFVNPQPDKYRMVYSAVSAQVHDTALLRQLQSDHFYNTAHYFSIKKKQDSALVYLDSVNALNRENLLVQELINATVIELVKSSKGEEPALQLLDTCFRRYAFLDRTGPLGEAYLFCLSKVAADLIKKDNRKGADEQFLLIFSLLEKHPELGKKSEPYVTSAITEMYYYYVRHRLYKEGKAYLQQVQKYYPDSGEIKSKMIRINDILENGTK